jgi:leucyl/phenylalanyl-tRNA--protein transferase
MVLEVDRFVVARSLKKRVRRRDYRIALDTDFRGVIEACAEIGRPDQDGTWITRDMVRAYIELHELGWAHCAEAWIGEELVGGVYGVCIGKVFCGESMFALRPDASKVAFVWLVRQLARWGVEVVDCQVHTDHLERFGAREWPRARFLNRLRELVTMPTKMGPWTFDTDFDASEAA